jgi:hypothetical protein
MIFKHIAAFVAGRAVHRIMCGRPFFADLDVTNPPAVVARAHKEWAATTRCYRDDPKTFMWEVVNLLVGIEAFWQSKPSKKRRKAMAFYAPLPEHITPCGRTFLNLRAPVVAKVARELTRRKVMSAERVLELVRPVTV